MVLALAICAPTLAGALRGDIDLVAACVRFLVAFVGLRIALGGIAHLLEVYRGHGGPQAARGPMRRATDGAGETS
jgi:hypothetical protein